VIVVNRLTDEVERVLNLKELARERMVVHRERDLVMGVFIKLSPYKIGKTDKVGLRKLARLLNSMFDFRCFNKPSASLGIQTIETEICRVKNALEGKVGND